MDQRFGTQSLRVIDWTKLFGVTGSFPLFTSQFIASFIESEKAIFHSFPQLCWLSLEKINFTINHWNERKQIHDQAETLF